MKQVIEQINNKISDMFINIDKVELFELKVPQREVFQSAVGERKSRDVLIVKIYDEDGNYGLGECSCRPDPFYSCEFLEGAWIVIKDFIVPLLPKKLYYANLLAITQKMRGWHFTGSAMEMAFNDLLRRKEGKDLLSQMPNSKISKIPVGISLGLFDNEDALMAKVRKSVAMRYHRIKFKIKPDMDISMFCKLKKEFPNLYFGYDANGSFNDSNIDTLYKLVSTTCPDMLEQPFAPERLDLCIEFKKNSSTPICLDESITGLGTLITAQRLGVLDELNIKPGRIGGLVNTIIVMDYCQQNSIPMWVGGMFETGVGRIFNLRIAAYLTNAKAHDLSPANRYFEKDIVTNSISMDNNGYINIEKNQPQELNFETVEEFTVRHIILNI